MFLTRFLTFHILIVIVILSPLQLNLKFEIEVLCKNLSLDINDLKPGTLLKDKDKLKSLEEQLSAPKKEAKPPEEMLPVVSTGIQHFQIGMPLVGVWISFYQFYFKCLFNLNVLMYID